MRYHKTMEGNWQLVSDRGEIQAQVRDEFLQHEMNRTGANEINTLRSLFAHAIRLQDTLDAMQTSDEETHPWWKW